MTEQDRGAYAPQNDAPLAFDPRRVGQRRGPAPIALILSALVLLAIAGGVLLLYRHGARHPGQPPQVVGAPVGDTRTAPVSSEAASDASASLQVYKTEVPPPGEGQPAFAPGPEQPQARPVTQPPAPAPVVTAAPLRAAEPAPTVAQPPAKVAVPPKAAVPPKVAPQVAQITAPAPIAPAKAAPPPKVAKTVVAAVSSAPPAPAATTGGSMVQIGALPTQAGAEKAWTDVQHKLASAMAGKGRKIETTQKDGKTFYRAYVTGFASHAQAESFCASLKAAGGTCIVR
jgi:SPOR domain